MKTDSVTALAVRAALDDAPNLSRREAGLARARAHNQELHELGHIRRHGGFQKDLPL